MAGEGEDAIGMRALDREREVGAATIEGRPFAAVLEGDRVEIELDRAVVGRCQEARCERRAAFAARAASAAA